MPDVNDKAPDFNLPNESGDKLSLKSFKGQPVVLYFYPKDDTPGCTQEAKDFTAHAGKFKNAGAAIIGVSKDSVARHRKFVDKYDIAYPLIADEDGSLCEAYGVWIEKSMYGRKYMGIERATFLIDGKGIIRQIWHKVKVKGHAEEVLAALKAL